MATETTLEGLFNISSPMDIIPNMYDITQTLTGGLFIYVFLFLPFLANWLISKTVVLPTVIYLVVGGGIMILLPAELGKLALTMLVFAGGGILYTWVKERY